MTDVNPYQPPESAESYSAFAEMGNRRQEPSGLGGWLILIAIGLVITPIRLVITSLAVHLPMFQDGTWEMLTTPGSDEYNALWAPMIIFEIVGNIGFLVNYIAMAFLFFRKSRFFPRTFIAVAIANLCFVVLDAWLLTFLLPNEPMLDPDTLKQVVRSLLSVALWVPYMLVSRRVKNTFVA